MDSVPELKARDTAEAHARGKLGSVDIP